jgi:hypothetical protein
MMHALQEAQRLARMLSMSLPSNEARLITCTDGWTYLPPATSARRTTTATATTALEPLALVNNSGLDLISSPGPVHHHQQVAGGAADESAAPTPQVGAQAAHFHVVSACIHRRDCWVVNCPT